MTDILIRDMEMPINCFCCPLDHGVWKPEENPYICCRYTKSAVYYDDVPYDRRLSCCGLSELPPHGRLIDADELIKHVIPENPDAEFRCVSVNDIDNAPTIIPAEEGE